MRLPGENISYVISFLLIVTSFTTLFVAPEKDDSGESVKVAYLIAAGVLSFLYMINLMCVGKVPTRVVH